MGEIRVKIRLSNSADVINAKRGIIDPKTVRWLDTEGVIDTGAVRTIIPIAIMQRLGALEMDRTVAEYTDGRKDTVPVTEPIRVEIMDRWTSEEALVFGDEVLIGQTILEKLDLLADCANRRLLPNHPNQPVSKVRAVRSGKLS